MNARSEFEARLLPHLDAAYNLARWLLRDERAAEDAVQEAALRALRYLGSLRGDDAKPWLLGIVRNTCFTMAGRRRDAPEQFALDDVGLELERIAEPDARGDPVAALERREQGARVDAAIRALSPALREVIVLRELEELDYAQIARVLSIPIGTVMSRLARARERLRVTLSSTGVGGKT
ncbi:MAG: sigma-70 family RNA polymerase sigma factor [Burkholderiales bacterium]|nr:sigma-70 family RNA polymerase sigma factor [Burkholderiales bacterium]